MQIENLLKGTQYQNRGISSIDELAREQFKHIKDRGRVPPRPHSRDLSARSAQEAQDLWVKLEASNREYTKAAKALLKAISSSSSSQLPWRKLSFVEKCAKYGTIDAKKMSETAHLHKAHNRWLNIFN